MPEDFDKVVGVRRDEDGNITKLVVENEDHSVQDVSIKPVGVGEFLYLTRGNSPTVGDDPGDYGSDNRIPWSGLNESSVNVEDVIRWSIDNPTEIELESGVYMFNADSHWTVTTQDRVISLARAVSTPSGPYLSPGFQHVHAVPAGMDGNNGSPGATFYVPAGTYEFVVYRAGGGALQYSDMFIQKVG